MRIIILCSLCMSTKEVLQYSSKAPVRHRPQRSANPPLPRNFSILWFPTRTKMSTWTPNTWNQAPNTVAYYSLEYKHTHTAGAKASNSGTGLRASCACRAARTATWASGQQSSVKSNCSVVFRAGDIQGRRGVLCRKLCCSSSALWTTSSLTPARLNVQSRIILSKPFHETSDR